MADLEFPLMDENLEIAKTNEILKDKNKTHFSTYCVASGRNYARICDGDYQKTAEHIKKVGGEFSDDQVILYPDHVKALCDGVFYSQLMQMTDSYMDGYDGEWITPLADLEKIMRVFWRNGFQIHVHTNGDLGMKTLLDTVETLMKESPREKHRTTIEHAGYFTEEQADRIAKLGLLVSAAPYYFYTLADSYSERGLGTKRAHAIHLIHKWPPTWDERAAKHGIEAFWDKTSRSSKETSETMSVVLSESDIPGSSLNGRNPSELKNDELRFWLKCRDDPAKGLHTKAQLVKR